MRVVLVGGRVAPGSYGGGGVTGHVSGTPQIPGPSPPLFSSKSSFSEKILTLVCLLKAAMMTFWSGAEEGHRCGQEHSR